MGVVPVVGVVCVGVGEVLVHGSPTAQGEHLESEADAQDGDFWELVELVDEFGFEGLSLGENGRDGLVGRDPERFCFWVVSS